MKLNLKYKKLFATIFFAFTIICEGAPVEQYIKIEKITVTGASIPLSVKLRKKIKCYEGQGISVDDIRELLRLITNYYSE